MKAVKASFVALLLCWAFVTFAQVSALAQVPVPPLTGRVVDQTGTLSSGDIDALTRKLKDFETRKGSQIAVLIVPTTQPEEIEQFSIRVAEAWKIGRKKIDDGAILLVAKNDRKLRIEVGYGLEGALTDVTSKRIIDEIITPKFRSGDFAGGISDGVDRIISVVDGEPLPAPPQHTQSSSSSNSNTNWFAFFNPTNPFVIIGVLFLGHAMRALLGRLIGSAAAGGVVAFLAWYFIGSLIFAAIAGGVVSLFTMFSDAITSSASSGNRGRWSSGHSSSSSGGWSSSSSSDSGSFSGGGGSFGGGGASGSW
jgi:uncharacterized protein